MSEHPYPLTGRVKNVRFEREDHGVLVVSIMLALGEGSSQSYCGPMLDRPKPGGGRLPTLIGGAVLLRVVDFFGGALDKAAETPVIAEGSYSGITRIRRLPCDGGAVLDFEAICRKFAS